MTEPAAEPRVALRQAGLRATPAQLVAVLGVLRPSPRYLSVDSVTGEVRSRIDVVSKQAIYNVLDEAGLTRARST